MANEIKGKMHLCFADIDNANKVAYVYLDDSDPRRPERGRASRQERLEGVGSTVILDFDNRNRLIGMEVEGYTVVLGEKD